MHIFSVLVTVMAAPCYWSKSQSNSCEFTGNISVWNTKCVQNMKKFTVIMIKSSYDVLTNPLSFWPQKEEGCVGIIQVAPPSFHQ